MERTTLSSLSMALKQSHAPEHAAPLINYYGYINVFLGKIRSVYGSILKLFLLFFAECKYI